MTLKLEYYPKANVDRGNTTVLIYNPTTHEGVTFTKSNNGQSEVPEILKRARNPYAPPAGEAHTNYIAGTNGDWRPSHNKCNAECSSETYPFYTLTLNGEAANSGEATKKTWDALKQAGKRHDTEEASQLVATIEASVTGGRLNHRNYSNRIRTENIPLSVPRSAKPLLTAYAARPGAEGPPFDQDYHRQIS